MHLIKNSQMSLIVQLNGTDSFYIKKKNSNLTQQLRLRTQLYEFK